MRHPTHKQNNRKLLSSRSLRLILAAVVACTATFLAFANHAGTPAAYADGDRVRTPGDQDLFGMVVRDPFYEYNTDPVNFNNAPNRTALETQAKELASAGVKWVRMEFFADYDGSVPRGEINFDKYDYFINELAPKYGFKVLALLNVGMVALDGHTLRPTQFNDPPDGAGNDPNDGSNLFIRVFTSRAQLIAAHYGSAISAYEIINEPNINYDLWTDSRDGASEIKPDRYSSLISSAYEAIKTISPEAEVIVGGLMIGSPPEGTDHHDQFDYLYQLYVSPWVQHYRSLGYDQRSGWNVVPWDGVAVHPYYLDPSQLFSIINEFARKVLDRGDSKSRIWITEIGAEDQPPSDPSKPPTQSEIDQAYYLNAIYSGILDNLELHHNIAHVFWFKYEDFVPGNYTHNYGLVRLLEDDTHDGYAPSGTVFIHKLAYKTYQELAWGYKAADPLSQADATAQHLLYFDATQQAIAPDFTEYWIEKGGLGQFGYPISRPVMIDGVLSQFFQRAVLEYHPENSGTPNEVELRLLGSEMTNGRKFNTIGAQSISPTSLYFPETSHSLDGPFRTYWEQTGGLAVYGYPISEPMTETSGDGQSYTVQYFQRNRFEYHPEAAGTPYEVQLGLLGATLLKDDLWWR